MERAYTISVPGRGDVVLSLDLESRGQAGIAADISNGRAYEPELSSLFLSILRPGDIVVEVGTHVGYFTLLAALLAGPSGAVLGIEASAANAAAARANLARNGTARLAQVDILSAAASDRSGTAKFFLNERNDGGNALYDATGQYSPDDLRIKCVEVPTITLDTAVEGMPALSGRSIRLMKIDVEGAEAAVLSGARRLLAAGRVEIIAAELHESGLQTMGSSQSALRELMLGHGYHCFLPDVAGALPKWVPPQTAIRTSYIGNILFALPQTIGTIWPEIALN